jgi:hypothetical protein
MQQMGNEEDVRVRDRKGKDNLENLGVRKIKYYN